MIGTMLGPVLALLYFATVLFVVWLVVTSLRRISAAVEDIARTLQRMESNGSRNPGTV